MPIAFDCPDYVLRPFLPGEQLSIEHLYVCRDNFLLRPITPLNGGHITCMALEFPRHAAPESRFSLAGVRNQDGQAYCQYRHDGTMSGIRDGSMVVWVVVFEDAPVTHPETITTWHTVLGQA